MKIKKNQIGAQLNLQTGKYEAVFAKETKTTKVVKKAPTSKAPKKKGVVRKLGK